MRYYLVNDELKVEIDSFGAEVKSILSRRSNREYMWYGDPKFWGRTSPVLFPFVGSVKNKEYRHQGQTYPMGQHGFARDNEFTLVERQDDRITFEFRSNEKTLAVYPFAFVLRITYVLQGRDVTVQWQVTNPAEETLHFSIGAHPAFLSPLFGEKDQTGYKIRFEGAKEIHYYGANESGMARNEDVVMALEDECVSITPDFYDWPTYIIEGQTKRISLETPDGRPFVAVSYDAPLAGIWSPPQVHAPFVCIEPWYGRADGESFEGELCERKFGQSCAAGETFEAAYTMTFYEV